MGPWTDGQQDVTSVVLAPSCGPPQHYIQSQGEGKAAPSQLRPGQGRGRLCRAVDDGC